MIILSKLSSPLLSIFLFLCGTEYYFIYCTFIILVNNMNSEASVFVSLIHCDITNA